MKIHSNRIVLRFMNTITSIGDFERIEFEANTEKLNMYSHQVEIRH